MSQETRRLPIASRLRAANTAAKCYGFGKKRRAQRRIWLSVLFLHVIATGQASPDQQLLSRNEEDLAEKYIYADTAGDGDLFREGLIQFLQEALSEASFHSDTRLESLGISPGRRKRLVQWKNRWVNFRRACKKAVKSSTGVASVTGDQLLASTAMAAASIEREVKDPQPSGGSSRTVNEENARNNEDSRTGKKDRANKRRERRRQAVESELDLETAEGARLLSASFGFVANTFGLLADSVRVVGETAAGVTGSSVKLMGTAVKTMSSGLDSAGRVLEPKEGYKDETVGGRRSPLTSERLKNQKRGVRTDYPLQRGGLLGNTRNVAAKSVRLLGSVVRGVGDTLVLAGAATESVASSTTGVAEDAVRIVESFAGSLSHAIMPQRYLPDEYAEESNKVPVIDEDFDFDRDFPDGDDDRAFVSYGSYVDTENPSHYDSAPALAPSLARRFRASERQSTLLAVVDLVVAQISDLSIFVMADTEGIPSFATELLGVMFLCYLAAVLTHPVKRDRRQSSSREAENREHQAEHEPKVEVSPGIDIDMTSESVSDLDSLPSCAGHIDEKDSKGQHEFAPENSSSWDVAYRLVRSTFLLPGKYLIRLVKCCLRFLFGRKGALLAFYFVAWLFLSRGSQMRSISIHRSGESKGFRSAVSSVGTSSPSVTESVVWLNALVDQMWRIPYDPESKAGKKWARELRTYPKFVTRAMENDTGKKRSWPASGGASSVQSEISPYGGLEPYISSYVGKSLFNALDSSKTSRPNDVAYVSLYSLTLGSKPPLLRSMALRGVKHDGRITQYLVDVDAMLDDFSLVVEIKLSSLEYALLPSTKISINSLEMRVPIAISLSSRPDYPYVSKLRMSLASDPDCKVRITPLSDDSGLRGVDLGSLPVMNDWVRDVIRGSLSEYVSPKYVAVDVGHLLSTNSRQSSATPSPTRPDITQLRQRTRQKLNTNPRALSSSRFSSMTSVADHLASHHSATKVVGEDQHNDSFAPKPVRPLVRPKTELAQMGMERWTAKSAVAVNEKPVETGGLVSAITKPLTLVAPFVLAIAAAVFRDRLFEDDGSTLQYSE